MPSRLRVVVALFVASSLLGPLALQALGAGEASWPQFQGDSAHQGVFSDARFRAPLRLEWRSALRGDGRVSAAAVEGELAVATTPDAVVAFSVADGAIRWRVNRLPGQLIPPVIAPDIGRAGAAVFAEGSRQRDSALTAVDLGTRRRLWTARVGPIGSGGPTVAEGRVFAGTTRRSVVALDGKTGRLLWTVKTDGSVNAAPAVSGQTVFAVSENRENGQARLYAMRANGCGAPTCRPQWSFSPPGIAAGSSSPTVSGSTVYLGFGDASVRALDVRTGRVRWTGRVRSIFSPRTAFAVTGNELYVLDGVGGLYRFDARTGERLWDYQFPANVTFAAPLVVPDPSTVFVGLDDGTVAAVDGGNGHLRWQSDTGSAPVAAFAAATKNDDPVLIASAQGRRGGLLAFVPDPNGKLVDIESPTVLDFGAGLRNFGVAFVLLTALLLAFFRFLPRRETEPVARAEGADQ